MYFFVAAVCFVAVREQSARQFGGSCFGEVAAAVGHADAT